jgi:tetratricopeptide (TPR) repeat protein
MKKFIFFLLAAVSLQMTAFSQSDKYVAAMKKNLALFDSSKTVEDYTKLANTFERIGDAEKTQWLPYYYAGLALTTSGWTPAVTDKDANAARINSLSDKAESIAVSDADKAEILTLRNMAATQQMMVDPQNRWMSYGQAAGQALEKALQLDPNNPRLYYLKGMSLFGTPEQFGGGKDKAKPVFEKAVQLYKEQKPKELYPRWGQKQAEDMIVQCQ